MFALYRGRPTVGRLWEVKVVEPWTERERRLKQLARKAVEGLLPTLLGGSSGPLSMLGEPFASMGSPLNFMSPMLGRGIVVVRARTVGPDGIVEESTTTSDGDTARIIMRVQKSSDESIEKLLDTAGPFGNASGRESVASLMESLLHKTVGGGTKDDGKDSSVLGETVSITVNADGPFKEKEDIRAQILSQLNRIILGGNFDAHASADFGDNYLFRVLPQHELDDTDENDHSGEHDLPQQRDEMDSDRDHSDEDHHGAEGEPQKRASSPSRNKHKVHKTVNAKSENKADNKGDLKEQTELAMPEEGKHPQEGKPVKSTDRQQQSQEAQREDRTSALAASNSKTGKEPLQ